MSTNIDSLLEIASRFATEAAIERVELIGEGHIHESYRCHSGLTFTVLQRINDAVFPDVEGLMRNILAVLAALEAQPTVADVRRPGPDLVAPQLLPVDGCENSQPSSVVLRGGDGSWWRMWRGIEGAAAAPVPADPPRAHACGIGFGAFLRRTEKLSADALTETIPRFHDIELRLEQLAAARRSDRVERVRHVGSELAAAEARGEAMRSYLRRLRALPTRVTHNDTKFNNILLDTKTGAPRAVIDLDTVMAGHAAFDFGDGARTGCATAAEDSSPAAAMEVAVESFAAYAEGFLAAAELNSEERELLADAPAYMTHIMAVRFLTDFICGDRYYHVEDPEHNLRRTRAQLALLVDWERRGADIAELVR